MLLFYRNIFIGSCPEIKTDCAIAYILERMFIAHKWQLHTEFVVNKIFISAGGVRCSKSCTWLAHTAVYRAISSVEQSWPQTVSANRCSNYCRLLSFATRLAVKRVCSSGALYTTFMMLVYYDLLFLYSFLALKAL